MPWHPLSLWRPIEMRYTGSRNCAARQRELQIFLNFADKSSKRNINFTCMLVCLSLLSISYKFNFKLIWCSHHPVFLNVIFIRGIESPFSVINNLDTPSSKLQIIFGVLQFDTDNSATGIMLFILHFKSVKKSVLCKWFVYILFLCFKIKINNAFKSHDRCIYRLKRTMANF